MAIKLIALDLDGTLLTTDKRLTDRTRKALSVCAAKGIHIVPATGRAREGIPQEIVELPGVRYAITANGAAMIDLENGRQIGSFCIPWNKAAELVGALRTYPVMCDAYISGRGKCEERFLYELEEYGLQPEICRLIRETRDIVTDLKAYIAENQCAVDKINLTFKKSELENGLKEKLRLMLEEDSQLMVTSSMKFNLELNDRCATKGGGLTFLSSHLGLKKEEMMAFGDGENDVTMLQTAGISVAMGNSISFLKEQADFVTSSNDQDGVAAAIEALSFA